MAIVTIEHEVLDRLPGLRVDETVLERVASVAQIEPSTLDALKVRILETTPRRLQRLGAGVGRFTSFGHPIGGYYGRDNEIRVYRRGAKTTGEMSASIIRGIAAVKCSEGVDYEQQDAMKRFMKGRMAAGSAIGLALGNIPTAVNALVYNAENSEAFLFKGSVIGASMGGIYGVINGVGTSLERYPRAGSGGLQYYLAEGLNEHLAETYKNEIAPTTPLVAE